MNWRCRVELGTELFIGSVNLESEPDFSVQILSDVLILLFYLVL